MSRKAGVYWDESWNVVTGCTPCSPACENCWARATAERFPKAHGTEVVETGGQLNPGYRVRRIPFSQVLTHPDRLDQPLHWRKPRVVAVCWMGDLGHKDVPDEFIFRVWEVMEQANWHTFLILAKRPKRLYDVLGGSSGAGLSAPPLPNVWMGVTAEDQAYLKERWAILREIPAAGRFISLEPLLEGLGWQYAYEDPRIHGFIAGCESGSRRRPAPHDWFRVVRNHCKANRKDFYLKQMAENEDGTGKVIHAPHLDGRQHLELAWEAHDEVG